jgi:hypothetical protein
MSNSESLAFSRRESVRFARGGCADDLKRSREAGVSATVIEQAKIQAQVLVPLVKALQAELGEPRANAVVRKELGDLYRRRSLRLPLPASEGITPAVGED